MEKKKKTLLFPYFLTLLSVDINDIKHFHPSILKNVVYSNKYVKEITEKNKHI